MNTLSVLLTLFNASLLAGSLGGLFLGIPARNDLSNKERVQTTLLRVVSERDAEIATIRNRKNELETAIPLFPGKIEETKKTLKVRQSDLLFKKEQYDRASSTLAILRKQNSEKEVLLKKLLTLNLENATTTTSDALIGTTTVASTSE